VTDEIALVVLAAGRGERFGGLKQLAPAGPNGEALMDYSIHNALTVGFTRLVVVVRAEIEETIRAHFRQRWDLRIRPEYAVQPTVPSTGKPAGTAYAVLATRPVVGDQPLVAINADDVYGATALGALHGWLSERGSLHALVAFPLVQTLLPGTATVARALCHRRPDGMLSELVEAAVEVSDGTFVARPFDRGEPIDVDANQLVSMNAFAFRPSIWPILDQALDQAAAGTTGPSEEALLPAVIGGLLDRIGVVVLPVADRCVGITWSRDLEPLQQEIRRRIEVGDLPATVGA
jgi:hypothetical protein